MRILFGLFKQTSVIEQIRTIQKEKTESFITYLNIFFNRKNSSDNNKVFNFATYQQKVNSKYKLYNIRI